MRKCKKMRRFFAIIVAFIICVIFILIAERSSRDNVSEVTLKLSALDDDADEGEGEGEHDPIHNDILQQSSKLSQRKSQKQSQEHSAVIKQIPFRKKSVIKATPHDGGGGDGLDGGDGGGGGVGGKKSYFQYLRGKGTRENGSALRENGSALRGMEGYYGLRDGKLYTQPGCGSCALVSSSGQLIDSGAGAAIDAHECVFRMNVAPVRGFENDVGNKTTIRFLSHTSVPILLRDKNNMIAREKGLRAVIQWGPNDEKRRENVAQTLRDNFLNQLKFRHTEFYALTQKQLVKEDESFEKETGMNRDASGSYLSTGWFTISFMRKLCNEIDVYGMVNDDYCRSKSHSSSLVPYHYWEQKQGKECATYIGHERGKANVHRFITEKKVFRRWAKAGKPKTRFFHPEWS